MNNSIIIGTPQPKQLTPQVVYICCDKKSPPSSYCWLYNTYSIHTVLSYWSWFTVNATVIFITIVVVYISHKQEMNAKTILARTVLVINKCHCRLSKRAKRPCDVMWLLQRPYYLYTHSVLYLCSSYKSCLNRLDKKQN